MTGAALAAGAVLLLALGCRSESGSENVPASAATTLTSTGKGPVRLAHFTVVSGDASWRAGDSGPWSQAAVNLPIRQGAQLSTTGAGRAEVEFDDGSRMRVGSGALVTLKSLYSDADGEFTQLSDQAGTVDLTIPHDRSVYEIDTPLVSVDGTGPSRYRVDADGGVRVAVHSGNCTVDGDQGKKTLGPGDYLALHNANDSYDVTGQAPNDAFDDWTATLDATDNRVAQSPNRRYIPRNVAISGDDLDDYGTWRTDPTYKEVWYPRVTETNWRPYHHGHWVWVEPYGWTWVGNEPWGWGPYHYGSWICRDEGWAWVPGPNEQCWTPGGVEWCQSDGVMAWTPYGPQEVSYGPSLSIGFSGGDWSAYFSIGSAAVFYPNAGGYCEPCGFSTGYVNNFVFSFGGGGRGGNNYTVNNFNGGVDNRNRFLSGSNFMPANGQRGTSFASATAFSGSEPISTRNGDPSGFFRHAQRIGAPSQGDAPVAGPPGARPSALSLSATRSFRSGDPVVGSALAQTVHQGHGSVRTFADARQSVATPGRSASSAGQRPATVSRERSAAVQARSVLGGGRQAGNGAAVPSTMRGRQADVGRTSLTAAGSNAARRHLTSRQPGVAGAHQANVARRQAAGHRNSAALTSHTRTNSRHGTAAGTRRTKGSSSATSTRGKRAAQNNRRSAKQNVQRSQRSVRQSSSGGHRSSGGKKTAQRKQSSQGSGSGNRGSSGRHTPPKGNDKNKK
jgi:hypothetical protein